jgi:AcrR family transcriptional regulator
METYVTKKVSIVLLPIMTESEIKPRIQQAAHDLVMQYSIRSVSMDDIANSLGISKKTIYQYFKDKEELIDAVVSDILEKNQACCNIDREKAENAVHEIFLAAGMLVDMFKSMNPGILYDMQKYHPQVFNKFLQFRNGYLLQTCRENLERGLREGLYREGINIEILCKYRVETVFIPFNPEFRKGLEESFTALQEEIIINFLFGLVNEKGYAVAKKYLEAHMKKHHNK